MLDVLYRMGLRGKATVHGFRGLASTVLNESGLFDGNWIEYQLAHRPGGMDRRHNPAQFLRPRRFMMQGWADYLETAETGMSNGVQKGPPIGVEEGPPFQIGRASCRERVCQYV